MKGLFQAVPAVAKRSGREDGEVEAGVPAGEQIGHHLAGDRGQGKAAAIEARRQGRGPGIDWLLPIKGRPSAVKPMIPAQHRTTLTPFNAGKSVVRQRAMPLSTGGGDRSS